MSTNGDAFKIQIELGDVIRHHNETLERLRAFQRDRPYVVAPNVLKMVEENLKENVAILYKQWNEVHKPPAERVRHVCRQCNFVFASSLPEGICDECRSKGSTAQPAAYGNWPQTPESESETLSDATPLPPDVVEPEMAEDEDAALVEQAEMEAAEGEVPEGQAGDQAVARREAENGDALADEDNDRPEEVVEPRGIANP